MWEKIVFNLLSNAFKFTFDGSVRVTLEALQGRAVLTVADTGIGIVSRKCRIFLSDSTGWKEAGGRTYEGTGIALLLVQELVKLHAGTVHVTSRPGLGSSFTVTIPFGSGHLPQDRIDQRAAGQASTRVRAEAFTGEAETWIVRKDFSRFDETPEQPSAGIASVPRRRILLADDNADMREVRLECPRTELRSHRSCRRFCRSRAGEACASRSDHLGRDDARS
jgi:hypothetical protein